MFERKRCPNCDKKVKDSWKYCPYCGSNLTEKFFKSFDIFEKIDKEFERIDKIFGKNFLIPKIRVKPFRGGGISITISSRGKEPKIEVKTFGDYKKIEPEIKKRLGVKPRVVEIEEKVRKARVTEEPESKVRRIGNKEIITIKLPGVKEEDVEVKRLEQSIEIRAYAGDKAYFKLIPIPPNASIEKEFKNGVLTLKIER